MIYKNKYLHSGYLKINPRRRQWIFKNSNLTSSRRPLNGYEGESEMSQCLCLEIRN